MKYIVIPARLPVNIVRSQLEIIDVYVPELTYFVPSELAGITQVKNTIIYRSNISLFLMLIRHLVKDDIVYCRDVFNFVVVRLALLCRKQKSKFRMVYDFRALRYQELLYKERKFVKVWIIKQSERFAYLQADKVQAVSYRLSKELKKQFGERAVGVTPCFISKVASNLPLKIPFSFVYVGGLSKWQKFEDILRCYNGLFNGISEYGGKPQFLILTADTDKALKSIANIVRSRCAFESISLKTVSSEKVLDEIKGFQYGFILRDEHVMNNVSCPIKLCEYLSVGVVPIMSSGIGDFGPRAETLGYLFNGCTSELESQILAGADTVGAKSKEGIMYAKENFLINRKVSGDW